MPHADGKLSLPRMQIVRGDITQLAVDAIVNAANSHAAGRRRSGWRDPSRGGSGVAGGMQEVRRLSAGRSETHSRLSTAREVSSFTPSGQFGRAEIAARKRCSPSCYRNSLSLRLKHGLKTIAFPAISCGAYGYPIEEAAEIAVESTAHFLRSKRDHRSRRFRRHERQHSKRV